MDDSLSKTDLKVLNTLGTFHNAETGWCYAKYKELADKSGCHRVTVINSMKRLIENGYVVVRPQWRADGGQTCNEFKVLFDEKEDYSHYKNTKLINKSRAREGVAISPSPSSEETTPPVVDSLLPSSQATLPPSSVATLPRTLYRNTNQVELISKHTLSERERKISLEELSVDHFTDWIEQRKVTAKTPLEVNLELCIEQMKAHYLANGGMDGAGRKVVDWVEKAKRWILEEQKNLEMQRVNSKRTVEKNEKKPEEIQQTYIITLQKQKSLDAGESAILSHWKEQQKAIGTALLPSDNKPQEKPPDEEYNWLINLQKKGIPLSEKQKGFLEKHSKEQVA